MTGVQTCALPIFRQRRTQLTLSFNQVVPSVPSPSAPSPLAPSPAPTSASLPSAISVPEPEPTESPASEPAPQAPPPPAARAPNEPRLPSSLADLVTSFESAKQKCALLVPLQGLVEELMSLDAAMRRENDLGSLHEILDAGFSSVPQPQIGRAHV